MGIPRAAIDWTWSVAHTRSAGGTLPICSVSFPHNTGPLALGSGCIAPPDHWLSIPLSKGPTVYRAVTSPLLPVPFHGELP